MSCIKLRNISWSDGKMKYRAARYCCQIRHMGGTDIKSDIALFVIRAVSVGGGLSGYVKSKPLGNGQIISIDGSFRSFGYRNMSFIKISAKI